MELPDRKVLGIYLLFVAWGLGTWLSPALARDQPGETEIMSKSNKDDDDEVIRRETLAKVEPLLTPELIPGFEMTRSGGWRHHYRKQKQPTDSIFESWDKDPPTGFSRATFINIHLYVLKNQAKALKAAKTVFHATTDKKQYLNAIGKPNPGSFSGQPIGDYCWAFKVFPRKPFNSSSSLVVIEKNYLFKIQVAGSGDTGAGIEDQYAENLAKALVRRLKAWKRPE